MEIGMNVTIIGSMESYGRKVCDDAERMLNESAALLETTAKTSIMQGTKSGKTYKRAAIKRCGKIVGYKFHRASAPGQAPATDYGVLVNSIHMRKPARWVREVVASAEYAADLEYGTVRIAARPYMRPALEVAKKHLLAGMKKALNPTHYRNR